MPRAAVTFRALAAEAIGTFGLVFAGTGAIVIDEVTHGAVTHVSVGLTFGLINPGSLWIYVVAPIIGACAGVYACRAVRGAECCASPAG